jgi:putative SOS response-associated peptidase YedK
MCSRYSLICIDDIGNRFRVFDPVIGFRSRFAIAPGTTNPVIIHSERVEAVQMRWGLIPSWTREPVLKSPLINARSETLAVKPSFRILLTGRRCLVPATGFFEWKNAGAQKAPYYFRLHEGTLFAFAGLWDTWAAPDGPVMTTYTLVTTEPNVLVAEVHNRMPAILRPEDEERWAGNAPLETDALKEILAPYPAEAMERYRVSKKVNNPRYDAGDAIAPVNDSRRRLAQWED